VICQLALGIVFFAVITKVLFPLIPQKTSTSFSVRPKLSRFLAFPQTRLAIEGGKKHLQRLRNKTAGQIRLLAAQYLPSALVAYDSTRTADRIQLKLKAGRFIEICRYLVKIGRQ
jgi:hypothetical protein